MSAARVYSAKQGWVCSATQPTVTPLLSFLGPGLPQVQVNGLVSKWRGVSVGGWQYGSGSFLHQQATVPPFPHV